MMTGMYLCRDPLTHVFVTKLLVVQPAKARISLTLSLSILLSLTFLSNNIARILLPFRYWLYAAVKLRCLLVTNDEMRDHIFELLGSDLFLKWKEKHQVQSSLSPSDKY